MESVDLYRATEAAAKTRLARGETAAQVRWEADEKERTGFSVSADYTRLVAGAGRLERR